MDSTLYALFIFLLFSWRTSAQTCTCPGVEVSVSSHSFCFQIQHSTNSTWADADQKCSSLGGFLAHLDSSSLISNVKSYVQSNYQLPLLTGGLLGNAEYQLIALMCPNNSFMSLLNTTIASEIINNASSSNGSCLFLETSDWKLHYGNCNSTYDILCQIPMDSNSTCGVMMQCRSSSTQTGSTWIMSSSTQSTRRTSPFTNAQTSGISSRATSNAVAASSNGSSQASSQAVWSSTPVSNSTGTTAAQNSTSNPNQTTTLNPNQTTTSNPNQTTTLNPNQTTTLNPNQTNSALSSTVSSFLSSISGGSTQSTKSPINSTGTTPYWYSTQSWPTSNSGNSTDGCDSGYTTLGSWCLPWWAWLVFGLLLFLVFFTLAICLVFMCVGRKKKVTAENYERLNTPSDHAAQQVRPSSEPPSSIYENKTDPFEAPAPYSAPNNHAPVYI